MNHSEILERLVELEEQLHRLEVRRNPQRLEELLHSEFEEIGRSGRRYSREEVLAEFREGGALPAIHAEGFELAVIVDGVALLTYRSAHVDEHGGFHRWTLRASMWLQIEQGWRMRFHQGTPAEAFDGAGAATHCEPSA